MTRIGIFVAPDGGRYDDWVGELSDARLTVQHLSPDEAWPSALECVVFEASPLNPDAAERDASELRRRLPDARALCLVLPRRPADRTARMTGLGDVLAGVPGPLTLLDFGALQIEHIAAGAALDAMLLTETGRPTPPLAIVVARLVEAAVSTAGAPRDAWADPALAATGAAAFAELRLWHDAHAQRWLLTLPADLRLWAGDIRTAALRAGTKPEFMAAARDLFVKLGHANAAALFGPSP